MKGIYFTKTYLEQIRSPSKILSWGPLVERWSRTPSLKKAQIQLQLTDICNLRCPFCSYRKLRGNTSLSMQQIERALEIFSPSLVILTGGGEPALYKWFEDAVRLISQKAERIGMITNGTVLPSVDSLLWERFEWVRISFYGPASYQSKTQEEKVLRNLTGYLNSPVKYCGVGILFDPAKDSISLLFDALREYQQMWRTWRKLNVQIRVLRTFGPDRRDSDVRESIQRELSDSDGEFLEFLTTATNLFEWLDRGRSLLASDTETNTADRCYLPILEAVIRPNGDVYPCDTTPQSGNWRIGNLSDGEEELLANTARLKSDIKPQCCPKCRYDAMNRILDGERQYRLMAAGIFFI